MKRTFLTLTLAAQIAAGAVFAQTSGTTKGTADAGIASGTFGSDWSTMLSSAMFGEGGATVRSKSEIVTQWDSLSEDDKNMLRRDCMAYQQQSGDMTGGGDTATGSADAAAGGSGTAADSTETSTDSTGIATDSTGIATDSTETQPGSTGTQSGASDTTSETSDAASSSIISVTMEQMEQICGATNDL